MRPTIAAFAATIAFVAAVSPASAAEKLSDEALKNTISGKKVFLATPLGGEFPLNYRSDGQVEGSGKAVGLGKFMQPTDSGRWWVAGDKLCQKWQNWYSGKPFCFTIERTGPQQIAWRRDDGLEGVARLDP